MDTLARPYIRVDQAKNPSENVGVSFSASLQNKPMGFLEGSCLSFLLYIHWD